MSEVLYRKYRPQTFASISGQNHIRAIISNEIISGQLAHAYLFCGPRGVGKTTMARVLAKAVNCRGRLPEQVEPCNACDSCLAINEGRNLDVLEIDAASNTGVDNVRENIIAATRTSSSLSSYKVFIIDEAHMLSTSAFNALLKTMEEPPRGVIFILCTTEIHKMPVTIISRCQRFDFKKVSFVEVVSRLAGILEKENVKADREILMEIAKTTGGHMRDAESLLNQILAISDGEIKRDEISLILPRNDWNEVWRLVAFLLKKDITQALALVNNFVDEGGDISIFNRNLLEALRSLLLSKFNCQALLGEIWAMKDGVSADWDRLPSAGELNFFLDCFLRAGNKIKSSFLPQLPVEMAIVESCSFSPTVGIATKTTPTFTATARPQMPVSSPIPSAPSVQTPVKETSFVAEKEYSVVAGIEDENASQTTEMIGEINSEAIRMKWGDFLVSIKKHNHSLSFILKVCEPHGIIDGRLKLAFKYKFHKDRVEEPHINTLIEQVLQEVYGIPLKITAFVDEGADPGVVGNMTQSSEVAVSNIEEDKRTTTNNNPNSSDSVDDILKTLGGKIVG